MVNTLVRLKKQSHKYAAVVSDSKSTRVIGSSKTLSGALKKAGKRKHVAIIHTDKVWVRGKLREPNTRNTRRKK